MKTKPDNTDAPAASLKRLVRRMFPAPFWALGIFGSSIAYLLIGEYVTAGWAFAAGAWCQCYHDAQNEKGERLPGGGGGSQKQESNDQ